MVLTGQGALLDALIDGVCASGHRWVGLWTWPGARGGRATRRRARRHGASVWQSPQLPPAADVLLTGDLPRRLTGPERAVGRVAAVNAHWSLLPRHRGPAPGAAAILAGDTESGVTFHTLDDELDRGRCVVQQAFVLAARETRTSLYLRASALARDLAPEVLARIEDGAAGPALGEGTWAPAPTPSRTRIDWSASATTIDRLVRACTVPAAWFVHDGLGVRVSQASVVTGDGTPGTVLDGPDLRVATGRDALRIERAWVPWGRLCWPWPGLRPIAVGTRLR